MLLLHPLLLVFPDVELGQNRAVHVAALQQLEIDLHPFGPTAGVASVPSVLDKRVDLLVVL